VVSNQSGKFVITQMRLADHPSHMMVMTDSSGFQNQTAGASRMISLHPALYDQNQVTLEYSSRATTPMGYSINTPMGFANSNQNQLIVVEEERK